jgi:4-hydroxy-tetrahydrodipicolinate synthase
MLTPFTPDGAIDWQGVDALVDWYIHAGVSGLFAVCLSSEMYKLTHEERIKLAEHVVGTVAGRVPVVTAGAFGESMEQQVNSLHRLAETGVDAVVVTVNQLASETEDDSVWQRNAETLFNACPGIPLGLYECPVPQNRKLSPAMLQWAARSGRVLFYKDTCCDITLIRKKLEAIKGSSMTWFNAHGPSLLESLRLGGHGYSGIAANFYPELFVQLCAQFADQPEQAEQLQNFLTLADPTIRNGYPAIAKRWLVMRGLPIGHTCRVPVVSPPCNDDDSLILANLRECIDATSTMAVPAKTIKSTL